MKFLCIGTMVPEQYEVKIAALSNAGNRFLWNLTNAIYRQNHEVQRISYMGIPVETGVKTELQENRDERVTYVWKTKNIVSGILNCHNTIYKRLKDADYLLAYNVVYAWLFVPVIARILRKPAVLVLADFSDTDAYSNLKRKLYALFQKWSIRLYDKVIGLSQNTDKILRKKQQFILMEGGINHEFYDDFSVPDQRNSEHIVLMYAGVLEKVTGVDLLLQAFMNNHSTNIKLLISGKGSLETLVRSAQEQDTRIQYLGCPVYDEYIKNLHKADILINPRNMNLAENRNNFPSKIMEYLATGKPILSTKFPGWERFEECVHFCGSDIESIENELICMVNNYQNGLLNTYKKNRELAKSFIWDEQVKRLLRELK